MLARLPARRDTGPVDQRTRLRLRRIHRARRRDDADDVPPWLPRYPGAGNARLDQQPPVDLTQATASSTVLTVVPPPGSGGRFTITTAMPSAVAASSLGRVICPPLFFVTSASMRRSRSKASSSS